MRGDRKIIIKEKMSEDIVKVETSSWSWKKGIVMFPGVNIFILFADTWTRKTEHIWVYQVE